ncbi:MAG: hypothetical protein R3190_11415 [Thermoanaerobaculia bacterium]|nr:hypothetical protein [Thermoanaerobaculia bacterium]
MPLDFVVETLAEIFARREEADAPERVNSLRYCSPAVAAAWRRRRELLGPARREQAEAIDVGARLRALSGSLPSRWRHSESFAARIVALEKGAAEGAGEVVESALRALDRELLEAAWAGLSAAEREEVESRVRQGLASVPEGRREGDSTAAGQRLRNRAVRRHLRLPVLSLFAPEAEEAAGRRS